MPRAANDVASLASLHPMHLKECYSADIKNSMKLYGSRLMALKRVSKNPDFSRPYLYGDPIHMIDWKAYARSDHLIVREQRDEASIPVAIILDISESMQWPDQSGLNNFEIPSKLEIGMRISLHLCHIHLRMGDQVHYWLQDKNKQYWYYKPFRTSHILSMFNQLNHSKYQVQNLTSNFKKTSILPDIAMPLYYIGDLLGDFDHNSIFRDGHLSCLFHLLSSMEVDISWIKDDHCYFAKSEEKKEFLGKRLRKKKYFYSKFNQWQQGIREGTLKNKGFYMLVTDKTPLHSYLNFLGTI